MVKSDFELYHEDEVLSVPTNRINTAPNSQTERLMRVFDRFMYDDLQDIEAMKKAIALDNMVGGQLDDYGDDYDMPRLGKSDDIYRFLLKLRSINRTSQGTFNELIRIISETFDLDPHEFQVRNDYVLNPDGTTSGTPFSVSVNNIPIDEIKHPEIISDFIEELSNALALGITLSNVEFVKFLHTNIYVTGYAQTNGHLEIFMNQFYDQSLELKQTTTLNTGIITHYNETVTMKGGLS